MDEIYVGHGVRFRYPDDWDLSEQQTVNEVTVTVSSRETSFWSLTLFFDRPQPEQVLQTAMDALRDEYEDIDVYPVETALCRISNLSRDVEFVCFELINSAFLREYRTARFTALVLYQATDHELQETRSVLEGISNTLQCDFDEDAIIA
jgi:hypothetical protein